METAGNGPPREGEPAESLPSTPPQVEPVESLPSAWTPDQRRNALAHRLQEAVSEGWRVESQTDFQATLAKGHRTNNILHLILTIVTLGLWLIVWVIVAITNKEKHRLIAIDEYGRVTG